MTVTCNDIDSGIECTLSRFADDTKLSSTGDTTEGWDAIQGNLDKLENWAHKNLVKFNSKYKELHLGGGNPIHECRLREELTESSPANKDLRILVEKRLDMSHQHVLTVKKAKHISNFIKRGVASTSKEVILTLYCALQRPQLE
ncbi:rna-directed dna polymerase from mobile element jockey-like [Pitangus sulphuratus]|nr:rna-directed dna polymerase from mobile element jockey-like [Pitangus sulphuratus]KAJ7425795.1 rna-directed dna polymerase from mobile element jockey-like [Pitangus sulphuratus]